MVGFDPVKPDLQKRDFIIAGAASGFITRLLFQPLDVLKIRFQLQIEPVKVYSPRSKYKGVTHAMKCIYKEEGITAFWKGLVPAQCLSSAYGALQFSSFEILTKQAWNYLPLNMITNFKPIIHFTCGALSGCIATAGSFPFDVLRTRMIGQGEPKVYKSLFDAGVTMMVKEGPSSFYKGLSPALLQIAPAAGARFALYKLFVESWDLAFSTTAEDAGALKVATCGASAGIVVKIMLYPLDMIKKRLQVQGFEEARKPFGAVQKCVSFMSCVRTIILHEGFFGLYKGLYPSILKAAFTVGGNFFFYEETCVLLEYMYYKREQNSEPKFVS